MFIQDLENADRSAVEAYAKTLLNVFRMVYGFIFTKFDSQLQDQSSDNVARHQELNEAKDYLISEMSGFEGQYNELAQYLAKQTGSTYTPYSGAWNLSRIDVAYTELRGLVETYCGSTKQ